MKILFLTTAHNSLSQRLYLTLATSHTVSIEYALDPKDPSDLIQSVQTFDPDLIICPFLTSRVPAQIYEAYMTLIIHPGPPGDAGPSALDWLLMGDDGSEEDAEKMLKKLNEETDTTIEPCARGRKCWGVSVIQAVEKFDAGPVWAFEQFPIEIDDLRYTKSSLYRGPVTRAAISATLVAITRLSDLNELHTDFLPGKIKTSLVPYQEYSTLCTKAYKPFRGGKTHDRPLLKAADRDFDITQHTAKQISRRIRSADSQPGAQSRVFGPALYIYGGIVDDLFGLQGQIPNFSTNAKPGDIIATRNEAVCIKTVDYKGIWITHIRRLKRKGKDVALWPKVPACFALVQLGIISTEWIERLEWNVSYTLRIDPWSISAFSTFQEVWIERDEDRGIAMVYFEFYNGAMSTRQCKLLLEALKEAVRPESTQILVLMGGSNYFSNGIALNVIESYPNPSEESWKNINAINDVVEYLLKISIRNERRITTFAGVRGNAAAGGVALMASRDFVICAQDVVLNPAYKTIGLYGSEFHTLSYYGRCGREGAKKLLNDMLPIMPDTRCHLFDRVIEPSDKKTILIQIREAVIECYNDIMKFREQNDPNGTMPPATWKQIGKGGLSTVQITEETIAQAKKDELDEMKKDFWGPRSKRYHERRFDFVRKVRPEKTPLRFAVHRREEGMLDEEEKYEFGVVGYWEWLERSTPAVAAGGDDAGDGGVVVMKQELFGCYYAVDDE